LIGGARPPPALNRTMSQAFVSPGGSPLSSSGAFTKSAVFNFPMYWTADVKNDFPKPNADHAVTGPFAFSSAAASWIAFTGQPRRRWSRTLGICRRKTFYWYGTRLYSGQGLSILFLRSSVHRRVNSRCWPSVDPSVYPSDPSIC
jgi:hypothetical protein